MSDSVFTPEALANSTFTGKYFLQDARLPKLTDEKYPVFFNQTDQILTIALTGKEVRTLAPIYIPLPLNALLLGILTWMVGKYFMVYGKTDSRMTKGLVVSLMLLGMATTGTVCSEYRASPINRDLVRSS
jgi:hypothetical protein